MSARYHIALVVLLTFSVIAHTQPFQVERLSYLGGDGPDRTVTARIATNGSIVIAGDSTITLVNAQGSVAATTTISSDDDDQIHDVVIEPSGTILVAVETEADPYPVTGSVGTVEDNKRPMLLRFSADLSTVIAAFHFKIDHSIDNMRLSVGADGRILLIGTTEEDLFPTTPSAMHATYAGDHDGLLCVINSSLTAMLYATYIGDERRDTLHSGVIGDDGVITVVGVIGTGDDDSADHLFISLDASYGVKANRTEANNDQRQTMDMRSTSTSVILGVMSTAGPYLEVRTPLGVITRTVPTSTYMDALRSLEIVGTDVLVSGSYLGQSTTTRVDLVNADTVWTHRTGGSSPDTCYASRLTTAGLVTAGSTTSYDLPTTANAHQRTTLDAAGTVLDHWFSLASATVPPKTVITVTPNSVRLDSVILGTTRIDSVHCLLVRGPSTSITSASFLTPVPGLTIGTSLPQNVSSTASPYIVVRWTPADTGAMSTTLRIATPDTTVDIAISGWSHDTTSPPKPVITVTPKSIQFDSVILGTTRTDSIQCLLVSGPSTTITSATLLTPIAGLTIGTSLPQSVSTTSGPYIVLRWTPADTGTFTTTMRIATPDTTIDIDITGWSHDTTSPPPPPPKPKPRVLMSSEDLGVITMDQQQTVSLYVRIDSVTALTFDSVTVVHDASVQVSLPTMPRAATIPTDQLVLGLTATRIGVDSAVVTLHYPDSTASGTIHWVVLQPGSAQWVTSDVDRDTLSVGQTDTSFIAVRNIGSESGEIRDIVLTDDANGEITIDHATLPATIDPGASLQIRVITTPTVPHDIVVRCLVTFDDDGADDDTISAQYRYRSVIKPPPPDTVQPLRFAIDGYNAKVGERFSLSFRCLEGGDWLRAHQLQNVTFTMTYRRSVLTIQSPITEPHVLNEQRSVTITSSALTASDTAAVIELTACLGDADSSDIAISNISIDIDTGRIELDTTIASVVHIIDSWPSDTPRHVVRDTTMPAIEIYPNPVVGVSTLSLHACSPGATVMVHGVDGRFVYAWTSTMTDGVRDVHITLPDSLTPGMYVCTYRSNDTAVYRSFVVVR